MNEFQIGQKVQMKKKHPCGSDVWEILRVGADFKLKCCGCAKLIMIKRRDAEKNIKNILD
ncbi:MAG: DUF951 domain-containing protein [Lachnospiraceae bacterium]|nr:DUF951 domain-containing protein [Lachnospiraceae bacterium]